MKIKSIIFPAQFADGRRNQCSVAAFHLGDGPCGKTVTSLELEPNDVGFQIEQRHSDDTAKVFFYQWRDVTGRVEVEYA